MAIFELVSKYNEPELLPRRKTAESAGYDFFVAEDIVIQPQEACANQIFNDVMNNTDGYIQPLTLDEMAKITKETKAKPALIPTGVKAKLDPGTYLELSVRSSCPLKYWLIMANGVGRLLF